MFQPCSRASQWMGQTRSAGKFLLAVGKKSAKFWGYSVLIAVASGAASLIIPPVVSAAPPTTLTYQGKITKSDGTNLTTGDATHTCLVAGADTCDLRFNIYAESAGSTLLRTETFVNVELVDADGIFTLTLNSVCADSSNNGWTSEAVTNCTIANGGVPWTDDYYYTLDWDTDGDADFNNTPTGTLQTFPSTGTQSLTPVAQSLSVSGANQETLANSTDGSFSFNTNNTSFTANQVNVNLAAGSGAAFNRWIDFVDSSNTISILTGTQDPTSVATSAGRGSLFLREVAGTSGTMYLKQDDGSSTNWTEVGAGGSLTAGTVTNSTLRWDGADWVENTNLRSLTTGTASTAAHLTFYDTGTASKVNVLDGQSFGVQLSAGGDVGLVERLTILTDGSVGVGTITPGRNLDVAGDGSVANNLIKQVEGDLLYGRVGVTQNHFEIDEATWGSVWTAGDTDDDWIDIAMSSDGRYQTTAVNAGQIYTSADYGVTWTARDSNRDWISVAMSADGQQQTAAVFSGQMYTSADYGVTWTARDSSRAWRQVNMSADGKYQTGVGSSMEIYTSSDYGVTWSPRDVVNSLLGISMSSDGKYQTVSGPGLPLLISSDYGVTWANSDSSRNWRISAMSSDGRFQTATVSPGQLYTSSDYGATWTARDSSRSWFGIAISANGKYQTATVTNNSAYSSIDYGVTWTEKSGNFGAREVAMSANGKYQTSIVTTNKIYTSVAKTLLPAGDLKVAWNATISGTLAVGVMNEVDAGTCDAESEGELFYDKGTQTYKFCDGAAWSNLSGGITGALYDQHRQDDTTDSVVTDQVVRKGWGYIQGNGSAAASEAVTFGITYTDFPIVVASMIGYATSTPPSDQNDCISGGNFYITPTDVTTTAVTTLITIGSGTFSNSTYVCYSWIAIGSSATDYGADLAEYYRTSDLKLEAGDVVSLDRTQDISVAKSMAAYDSQAMGVIATNPGLVLGAADGTTPGVTTSVTGEDVRNGDAQTVRVALAGRVPVKISQENGPILRGDPLTASSVPGMAMKATKPGVILGRALENYDGTAETAAILEQAKGQMTEAELKALQKVLADKQASSSIGKVMMYVQPGTSTYYGEHLDPLVQLANRLLRGKSMAAQAPTVPLPVPQLEGSDSAVLGEATESAEVTEDEFEDNQEPDLDAIASHLDQSIALPEGHDATGVRLSAGDIQSGPEDLILPLTAAFLDTYLDVAGDAYVQGKLGVGEELRVQGLSLTMQGLSLLAGPSDVVLPAFGILTKGVKQIQIGNVLLLNNEAQKAIVTGDLEVTGQTTTSTSSAKMVRTDALFLGAEKAGTLTLKAGQLTVEKSLPGLQTNAIVIVTPTTALSKSITSFVEKKDGQFILHVLEAVEQDVTFDYVVIERGP
jgi:hypothetical protein